MKKTLLLCALPFFAYSQLTVSDDFSDGDFTHNPPWSGSDTVFEVTTGLSLHLNGHTAGVAYLSTASTIAQNASWEFYLKMDFNPSAANFAKVYLMSDNADLQAPLNGYFVRAGGSSEDRLSLYRQSGTTTVLVTESGADYLDHNVAEVRVKVTRSSTGLWTLQADTGNVPGPLLTLGSDMDITHQSSAYFGLSGTYTVTRADKFFLDDVLVSGYPYTDTDPPEMDSVQVSNIRQLELFFNEPVDAVSSADVTHYQLNPSFSQPVLAERDAQDHHHVSLTFPGNFQNNVAYQLYCNGVEDRSGNAAADTVAFAVNDPPPLLLSARPLDTARLEVLFSEPLPESSVENPGNYTVYGVGSPAAARQHPSDKNKVTLRFNGGFQQGSGYILAVQGVPDAFGHTLTDSLTFRYNAFNLTDDFSDGDFTDSLEWRGNDPFFTVNSGKELQLDAGAPGEAYLSTPSPGTDNAVWEFYTRLEFNPSSGNYARFYLTSDQSDLSSALHGYFVQIGSAADQLALYRQQGKAMDVVMAGPENYLTGSENEVRIKVVCEGAGQWFLMADTGTLARPFALLGTAVDSAVVWGTYAGVYCRYTSTRADKFFFDDVFLSGNAHPDNRPPEISTLTVTSDSSLEVLFNEPVTPASALDISNYTIENFGLPVRAQLDTGNLQKILLRFDQPFPDRETHFLHIAGVTDHAGNPVKDSAAFTFFIPRAGDLVINELMCDPEPAVGTPPDILPESEYVEIYNRTGFAVNLKHWLLIAGTSEDALPGHIIAPGGFVIITGKEAVSAFPEEWPVLGVEISGIALTNGGAEVAIVSPEGTVTSAVVYTDEWYGDENKTGGGWSLERIDPDECGGRQNWRASVDPAGGTPGKRNSVYGENPDTTAPELRRIAIQGDSAIKVSFSERTEPRLLSDPRTYRIEPYLGIDSLHPQFPSFKAVQIFFDGPLDPEQIYTFSLAHYPSDCSGNSMQEDSLLFTVPAAPGEGDILINEVLFDPYSGGSDFVEIYNHSNKIFDLKNLRLSNIDPVFRTAEGPKRLVSESFLLEPRTYIALTADAGLLKQRYRIEEPQNIVETEEPLPAMGDTEGNIAVATGNLKVIDFLEYTDDHHLAFLTDKEGVSLERISFIRETNDKNNWQSASSAAGYATPGYKNSQSFTPGIATEVSVKPQVFSPDQDGYKDYVTLGYRFKKPNHVLSVSIWNSEGSKEKELLDNQSVGLKGFVVWDGTDENGQRLNTGIYIVVFEFFHEDGTVRTLKETCVLSL